MLQKKVHQRQMAQIVGSRTLIVASLCDILLRQIKDYVESEALRAASLTRTDLGNILVSHFPLGIKLLRCPLHLAVAVKGNQLAICASLFSLRYRDRLNGSSPAVGGNFRLKPLLDGTHPAFGKIFDMTTIAETITWSGFYAMLRKKTLVVHFLSDHEALLRLRSRSARCRIASSFLTGAYQFAHQQD